jgi:ArsR family transcriptional regulator, arsenate/arsenite/antimonite-responsive transcriptional repressor
MNEALEAFKAAGDATRFRALRLLVETEEELCACEIIEALEKPQYTISKSLGILVAAGLVEERREGRKMMYSLIHAAFNDSIFAAIRSAPEGQDMELSATILAKDSERVNVQLAQRIGSECAARG